MELKDFMEGIENADEVVAKLQENLKAQKCKIFVDDGQKNIYIPKHRLDTKIGELNAANTTIASLNSTIKTLKSQIGDEDAQTTIQTLQTQVGDYEKKIKEIQINNAIELLAVEHKAHDSKDLKGFLDMDKISIDKEGNVIGAKEQLETLVKDKPYLFEAQPDADGDKGGADKGLSNPLFKGLGNPGKPDNSNLFGSQTTHEGDFGKLLAQSGNGVESEKKIDADYFFK